MILVVSFPEEEHTQEVIRRLDDAGREVALMDLSDFPTRAGMSLRWQTGEPACSLVQTATGTIDLERVRAAWWRRVCPFQIDPNVAIPSQRAFAESETSHAVHGMLDTLNCHWVNPRAADDAAHRKPYQWAVAQSVGLTLPRTLVTNRPEEAREFIAEVGVGKTVFKAFLATLEAWRETRLVEPEDLERLDLVRHAPVIFQEYIEGVDLRITVVGDQLFAGEIDARNTSYPVDMRMVIGEAGVRAVELPADVKAKLLRLQQKLGLYYGAIDMRRTPSGEYVFFEVNPAGQWLFVEERTGQPISQAIADLLMRMDDSDAP